LNRVSILVLMELALELSEAGYGDDENTFQSLF